MEGPIMTLVAQVKGLRSHRIRVMLWSKRTQTGHEPDIMRNNRDHGGAN